MKQKSTGVLCPKDGGDIVERKSRRGKVFYRLRELSRTATSRCGIVRLPEKCPDCGAPFLVEKITKRHGRQLICNNEECSYVRRERRNWRPVPERDPDPNPNASASTYASRHR